MAHTLSIRLGLILNKVFGKNSPVTKIIRVEIIVCTNTITKWLEIIPARRFTSMICAIKIP